jgi:hypothetical protein
LYVIPSITFCVIPGLAFGVIPSTIFCVIPSTVFFVIPGLTRNLNQVWSKNPIIRIKSLHTPDSKPASAAVWSMERGMCTRPNWNLRVPETLFSKRNIVSRRKKLYL